MFYRHRYNDNGLRDGDDGPEVDGGGDLWWEKAETMAENSTEIRNNVYDWNSPLHAAVEAGLDATNLDAVKVVTIISYLITFVVGFTGNTLVLYVIGRFSVVRRKSVANYYIWNLALADDLYVLALPLFCWATLRSVSIVGDYHLPPFFRCSGTCRDPGPAIGPE